jgi:hypothetical protein
MVRRPREAAGIAHCLAAVHKQHRWHLTAVPPLILNARESG